MVIKMSNNKLAIVLIRGMVNISPDVKKTLELLRLHKKHVCVVVEDNEVSRGMVRRVKDYVTYGTIDQETFETILEKRAQLTLDKKIDTKKIAKDYFDNQIKLKEFESLGLKPFFRLHPPKGGFERGGIKMPYAKGGVLGDRKDNMKDLISKML